MLLRNPVLFFLCITFSLLSCESNAQVKARKSPKASVSQRMATVDITIDYHRPAVKGRVIWGELVPYGMAAGNQYSDNKPYPWRTGANENTTISFSEEVKIEGESIKAGKYGLHMIPSEKGDWVIIFSNNSSSWGSYSYNEEEDALRVNVRPVSKSFTEWLMYGFDELSPDSATFFLQWEKLRVPIRISL